MHVKQESNVIIARFVVDMVAVRWLATSNILVNGAKWTPKVH